MSLSRRQLQAAALAVALIAISACSGGGGSGSSEPAASGGHVTNGLRLETAVAGDPQGAHVTALATSSAAAASSLAGVTVTRTGNLTLPSQVIPVGDAVAALPGDVAFQYPAQIAIPVDPNLIPSGLTLDDLQVYHYRDGLQLELAPVIGSNEGSNLLYAQIQSLGIFQAVAPARTFRIEAQQSIAVKRNEGFSVQFATRFGHGVSTFALTAVSQFTPTGGAGTGSTGVAGTTTPDANGIWTVAPSITLTSAGRLAGAPTDFGVTALTVTATDQTAGTPNVATMSFTVTVMERVDKSIPGYPTDQTTFAYDDTGNAFVLVTNDGSFTLSRIPADGSPTVTVGPSPVGANPSIAVSPVGDAVVMAYEQPVARALDFGTNVLKQVLNAVGVDTDNDTVVDKTTVAAFDMDLDGDGTGDLAVPAFDLTVDGFVGSDADLAALSAAVMTALQTPPSAMDCVFNTGFSGIRIVDGGAGVIDLAPLPHSSPSILAGGGARFRQYGTVNTANSSSHRRIFALEFNGTTLAQTGAAVRVDAEPVFDADDTDTPLNSFARIAQHPAVAFAVDHGSTAGTTPPLYCVAYEGIRRTDANGALRSDMFAVWRQFGVGAVTTETRLDQTYSSGDSAGDPPAIAGTAAGAMILWTERGGAAEGATPPVTTATSTPQAATPGEVALIMFAAPALPAVTVPPTPLVPVDVTTSAPVFVNATPLTTTGLHPTVSSASDNTFYAAWVERDDSPAFDQTVTGALASGRGSQSSALLFRRQLKLMASKVTSGGASAPFQVDAAISVASMYAPAIAASSTGEIAVSWVQAAPGATTQGYLRRFGAAGVALERPVTLGWPVPLVLQYDADDALGIVARAGGDLHVHTFFGAVGP
jgi:hypothetical protein